MPMLIAEDDPPASELLELNLARMKAHRVGRLIVLTEKEFPLLDRSHGLLTPTKSKRHQPTEIT